MGEVADGGRQGSQLVVPYVVSTALHADPSLDALNERVVKLITSNSALGKLLSSATGLSTFSRVRTGKAGFEQD